jgi:hypothetical protein
VDATKQYMALTWTGAAGATVDVYRDGVFLRNELNDGRYTNSRNLPGASQYTYKVCQAGPSAPTKRPLSSRACGLIRQFSRGSAVVLVT